MKLTVLTHDQCRQVRLWRNECLETLRTPYPLTEEMQEAFYRDVICNRNSPHRYWGIVRPMKEAKEGIEGIANWEGVDEIFVGMGGMTYISRENRNAEISLILDPELRGQGYGEKAVELLLEEAFHRMNLNCVYGECYLVPNSASQFWQKVVDAYDAKPTATLRARKFWDGRFWDSMYFDILRDEYDRRHSNTTQ